MKTFRKNNLAVLVASAIFCGEGDEPTEAEKAAALAKEKGGGIDVDSPEFKSAVAEQAKTIASKETDSLKTKNSDLINRLSTAKTNLAAFDGMEADKIKVIMQMFDQNEEAKLIADGKFEEVMQKRTDKIAGDFNDQIVTLTERAEKAEGLSSGYKTQLDQNLMKAVLSDAAITAGVIPSAIDDVVRRGYDVFSLNENGELEARDKDGHLVQTEEGLLLNPERFVNGLKETHVYYWAESEDGGTQGSKDRQGGKNVDAVVDNIAKSDHFDLDKYRAARTKQSGKNYHGRA